MSRTSQLVRVAAWSVAMGAVIGCSSSESSPTTPLVNSIFSSYVSLGNSITAGFQSGGINDSTQRQSYAVLLAKQMGTSFAIPSVNGGDGCRLTVNFVTKAQNTSPASGIPCIRNLSSILVTPNNVAVPGAASADPTNNSTPESNGLTVLFLGTDTQVTAALDAKPTFISIWIGSNDALPSATAGLPSASTPEATFEANYNAMIGQLVAGAPTAKGILIGAVNGANAPVLFPSSALQSASFLASLSQMAGKTITLDNSCTPTDGSLISLQIISDIASGLRPAVVSCTGGSPTAFDDVLTVAEQAQVATIVGGYNAFIQTKAASLGWAYWDPNPLLVSLKAQGLIPATPALTSPTAPFGAYVTLDGIHPSAATHVLIANALIDAINAKYGTTLAHTQCPRSPVTPSNL